MTVDDSLVRCDNCGRIGWHVTNRCPGSKGQDVRDSQGLGPVDLDADLVKEATRLFLASTEGFFYAKIHTDADRDIEVCETAFSYRYGFGRTVIAVDGLPGDALGALTPGDARRLAAVLVAAADELDARIGVGLKRWPGGYPASSRGGNDDHH